MDPNTNNNKEMKSINNEALLREYGIIIPQMPLIIDTTTNNINQINNAN